MQTKQQIVNGAELISQAAVDAGVNFFAGYPITPASSIYTALLNKLQELGRIAIGASDEISALAMCIGAAMRGAKSITSTSAPGLSLMIESIAYAFTTETPCVIIHGQRLGPSTGAATQSAQGDINFVRNFISGGYEIPVLAINSIFDSYATTIKAINVSEKLRTPVILLTEKDIIMSNTNIDVNLLDKEKNQTKVINRPYFNFESKEIFKTYNFNHTNEIPEFLAPGIGTSHRTVITASLHDKSGNLSKNSPEAFEVLEHLRAKIEDNYNDYDFHELKLNQSKISILSFLASDLSARQAIKEVEAEGIKVNHLSLVTLFPVLKKSIQELARNSCFILVPEVNYSGQYADIIRAIILEANPNCKIIKINSQANLINPSTIIQEIKKLV